MKIAVTTPTGHIGSKLANILLDRKSDVTLIARHPEKVKDLASRGAKVIAGEHSDPAVVELVRSRFGHLRMVAGFPRTATRTGHWGIDIYAARHGSAQISICQFTVNVRMLLLPALVTTQVLCGPVVTFEEML